MANRVDAIQRGVASYDEVTMHFTENADTNSAATAACNAMHLLRQIANKDDQSKCVVLATIAAWLNEDFEQTGRLFSVRDSGHITYDYVAGDHERKTIASLMAG